MAESIAAVGFHSVIAGPDKAVVYLDLGITMLDSGPDFGFFPVGCFLGLI